MHHTIKINYVSYHMHLRCTIPYTLTMFHTIYTNHVSYHVPILTVGKPDLTTPWHLINIVPYLVSILNRGKTRPHVSVAKTQNTKLSGQTDLTSPWKKPRIPNRQVKPTSRHRGKNSEYQTVGSNRPHGNVATNKPSGQTDLTATWQLTNRRVKPTSRQRGNY